MAPHFLLVPLPEQGHSSPMLSLASQLAALDCTATFLIAEKAPLAAVSRPLHSDDVPNGQPSPPPTNLPSTNGVDSMPPFTSNLRICTLPYTGAPSSLPEGSPRFDILKETLAGLVHRQQMVEKMVEESKSSENPIVCIICDILLCSWVMPLAKRQSISSAVLVPCSLSSFYLSYLRKKEMNEEIDRVRLILGLPERNNAAPPNVEQQKKAAEITRVFQSAKDHIDMSCHVLANSCKVLETQVLDVLSASKLNFCFVGPLFPAWELGGDATRQSIQGNIIAQKAGCPYAEDKSCLPWLDRQEKGSVLFLAFGSEVTPDVDQVVELAMGMEASGCKYLWVVRPDGHRPPDEFLERTRTRGMCISWAPQRAVLQHGAVGGFLTHCGWNSTVESVLAGVPMLCLPLNGDQYMNAHVIHAFWKVGLRMGPPNTLVSRADVERNVVELMSSKELGERVGKLQAEVQSELLDAVSSMKSFVQEIGSVNGRAYER